MKPPIEEGFLLGAVLDAGRRDITAKPTGTEQTAMLDASGLRDEDFLDPRVRLCWSVIARLNARRRPVDAIGLFGAARAVNLLRDAELDWLMSLQSTNELEGEAFTHAADDYRKRARGRVIADQLRQAAEAIYERGLRPAELSGTLEGITFQLTRDYAPDEATEADVLEVVENWDAHLRGERTGGLLVVPTGIRVLDEVVKGFVPGLNMILGDPGAGKSATMASIIEAQLDMGLKVGLFGLEEGYRFVTKRLLARDLKMAVGDIGIAPRNAEQEAKLPEAAQRLHDLYKGRFMAYKFDGVGIDEVCRRATHWILNKGAQEIWIDHIGEIRHRHTRDGEGYNWAVADSYRRLRDLGMKRCVPIIALAHRKPEVRDRPGPPRPNDVGLTGEAEKMVRRMLGIWREKQAWRITTLKNNEGKIDETVELERLYEAALIGRDGGRVVNLEQESREKKADERDKKRQTAREETVLREKWNQERKTKENAATGEPSKPAPGEAQQRLLDVPMSEKP